MRHLLVSIALLAAAPAAASAQDSPAAGSFAQLAGEAGCLVQTGALTDDVYDSAEDDLEGCDKGRGLFASQGVTVSPDGLHVYVAASGTRRFGSHAVSAYTRAPDTGRLAFVQCVSNDGGDGRVGTDGLCSDGDALAGASDVVLSPDGGFAYVASMHSNGVAWFARDAATGRLTQLGCVKEVPRGDRCAQGSGLIGASGVVVSGDGRNVYVSSNVSDAVATFSRDPETGAIVQTGCVSQTGSDGACDDGTALTGASSVAVAPDGATVYVTAAEVGAVTSFRRDAATGALTPLACVVEDAPAGGKCTSQKSLAGAQKAIVAPDGKQVLVAAREFGTLSILTRDPATGALAASACLQHVDARGEDAYVDPEDEEDLEDEEEEEEEEEEGEEEEDIGEDEDEEDATTLLPGCVPARALSFASDVAASADGRAVFVSSGGNLAAFSRDPLTGALAQVGCAESYRSYKSCFVATGFSGVGGIAASPDARNLYVVSGPVLTSFGAAVAVARRRARMAGRSAGVRLACPAAHRGPCAGRVLIAARRGARGHAFRIAAGRARTVRVAVPATVRRRVRARDGVRVSILVGDASRLTRGSFRRITLRR